MSGPGAGESDRGTVAPARSTRERDAVGAILVVLALGLALRVIIAYLLPGSGFKVDLQSFDSWTENLYQQEFDAGRATDLQEQLAAVERAEARLAVGTYGLSVESGEPIPDGRLEALPTAERTVTEEERQGGG